MGSQSTGRLWPRLNPRGTKNQNCIQVVALTATKAMHEFLVLHYLATDSAHGWEEFLSQCIPNGNCMPTTSRRAMLMNMFDKCHIAPSYRRMPHQSWATSMTLLVDLLCGNGKHRYLRTVTSNKVPVQVRIRGFSAGSYSGLSMCHILWRMQHVSVRGTLGGISLPPRAEVLHGDFTGTSCGRIMSKKCTSLGKESRRKKPLRSPVTSSGGEEFPPTTRPLIIASRMSSQDT